MKPLTYATFTNTLKKSLQQCGVDSPMYSGHSFRCGGATFALNCGVPRHYIKLQGDWLSNAYEHHLDTSLQYKIIAIKQEELVYYFLSIAHHGLAMIWSTPFSIIKFSISINNFRIPACPAILLFINFKKSKAVIQSFQGNVEICTIQTLKGSCRSIVST